ncbi:MAG TPA: hypothetical protein VFX48_07160 [Saprospiraceae bacterium]|nr:hypothetical protein [Saprospiraceae bacterium]
MKILSFYWLVFNLLTLFSGKTIPNDNLGIHNGSGCFDFPTPDEASFDSICIHPQGLEGSYIQGYARATRNGETWRAIVESRFYKASDYLVVELREYYSKYFYREFGMYFNLYNINSVRPNDILICDTTIHNRYKLFPVRVDAEFLLDHIGLETYVIRTNTNCPSFIKIISYNSETGELKIRFRLHFEVYKYSPNGAIRGVKRFENSPDYLDFEDGVIHTVVIKY